MTIVECEINRLGRLDVSTQAWTSHTSELQNVNSL